MNAKTKAAAPLPPMTNLRQASGSAGNTLTDARAKQVLKEAVDAVVNSFAKHTQGYGRGKSYYLFYMYILTFSPIRGTS